MSSEIVRLGYRPFIRFQRVRKFMIYDIYDLFLMESKIIDIFTLHKKIKDTYITHVLNRISFETVLSGRHFRLQKTGAV